MRLLSLSPRVLRTGNRLLASTPWRARILLLGTYLRTVAVDRDRKVVTITSRVAWFHFQVRTIRFDQIAAITYGYDDLADSGTEGLLDSSHNRWDHFVVGLWLADGSELTLFNICGDGEFRNESGLPDWAFWHLRFFNLSGSQEDDSRRLVDALCELIGVKVVRPQTL